MMKDPDLKQIIPNLYFKDDKKLIIILERGLMDLEKYFKLREEKKSKLKLEELMYFIETISKM